MRRGRAAGREARSRADYAERSVVLDRDLAGEVVVPRAISVGDRRPRVHATSAISPTSESAYRLVDAAFPHRGPVDGKDAGGALVEPAAVVGEVEGVQLLGVAMWRCCMTPVGLTNPETKCPRSTADARNRVAMTSSPLPRNSSTAQSASSTRHPAHPPRGRREPFGSSTRSPVGSRRPGPGPGRRPVAGQQNERRGESRP